jgi:hypothetical protein
VVVITNPSTIRSRASTAARSAIDSAVHTPAAVPALKAAYTISGIEPRSTTAVRAGCAKARIRSTGEPSAPR